jgi:heme exporter protein CcmB
VEGPDGRAPDEGELQRRRVPGRLILLLFGFALGPDHDALRNVAGGVLWLTVLFSGVLSFNRSYEQELENGALESCCCCIPGTGGRSSSAS